MNPLPADALRLLVIDDNADDRALVRHALSKDLPHARVDEVGEAAQLDALLADPGLAWDVVITDYQLCWSTGLAVFRRLRERQPDVPVILFTASGTEELAVSAMKEGVADYITKSPRHYGRIPYAVRASAERRQHERESTAALQALQRREAQLQVAMTAALMEAWEFDAASRRLLLEGRAQGPFAGQGGSVEWPRFLQGVHPDDRDAVSAAFEHGGPTGRLDVTFRRLAPADEVRWIRFSAIPGGPAFAGHWIGVAQDVSAMKQLEMDLRFADRQKNEFIAVLAHELRNPLAPLTNIVRLLSPEQPPERLNWMREVLSRQVAALSALLDDMLDVNRLVSGHVILQQEVMDLRVAVDRAIDHHGAALAAGQLRLDRSLPPAPVWVNADPIRLREMLDSLFDNAIKFTPEDGRLFVSLAVEQDQAVFRLRDTGEGLRPEMLERIFNPFVQSRSSPTQPSRGLGVGLATVRELAKAHGGQAGAWSAGPGQGSTFEIRLPHVTRHEQAASPAARPQARTDGIRVLLADDEPDVRATLAAVLEKEGYVVATAPDGASAIRTASVFRPHALVLDIGMPDVGGLSVARWLRAQSWGRSALLVAASGWGRDEDRVRTREAGFDIHLVKPVEVDVLLAALQRAPKPSGWTPLA